jgi:hypothetical protein
MRPSEPPHCPWPAEKREGTGHFTQFFELASTFVKYAVMRLIACKLVISSCMVADVFTKATDEVTFHRMNGVLRNATKPRP